MIDLRINKTTHIGMVREVNEDSILTYENNDYTILIVADGMGGHNAGEIASDIAVNTLNQYIEKNFNIYDDYEDLLRDAILEANKNIFKHSSESETLNGMGTTITALLVVKDGAYIAHVGDSRAYIVRDNAIRQITEDHSYINELLKKGAITEEEASVHPMKNLITRAVGTDKYVVIDTFQEAIHLNDYFILCSDGLTRYVTESEILEFIFKGSSVDEIVETANLRGGKDNISLIVARKEDIYE
ncbi:MAG: Stp1/IreP family PP2C-type Ser/Thr phosphatase [Clostridium sp.]